jgi:transposase
LRHGVIYRKLSGGTDSEAGSRFVERILSVVATCRQREMGSSQIASLELDTL